jgi:hypothetical protein
MAEATNINTVDLYDAIRNFGRFLKTEVKIQSEMISRAGNYEQHGVIINPGCTIQVDIGNAAPLEQDYPLIVFIGVGIGVQLPKTMPRLNKQLRNDLNFTVDLTNAPQTDPLVKVETIKPEGMEFEAITVDEKSMGYFLFPGKSIRYKFSLTYKECPNITQVKLYPEGAISMRHLFRYHQEIDISDQYIVDHF